VNNQEFIDLVWRLEEIMMQVDHLERQLGNCAEGCEGLDAQDDECLCPACCDTFARVLAETFYQKKRSPFCTPHR
jgi:hypothetical protein